MRLTRQSLLVLVIWSILAWPTAWAGQGCRTRPLGTGYMRQAVDAALAAEKTLNEQAAGVALIARVGSDISEHGLKFTHGAVLRKIPGSGQWRITHMLNACRTGSSYLANHGLLEFMLDDLHSFELLILVPRPGLQKALRRGVENGRAAKLDSRRYNLISNPRGPLKYQNSNHWLLEVVSQAQAAGRGRTLTKRAEIQRFFLQRGFRGSSIRISAMKRLGAQIGRPNVHFDDHPESARTAGRYEVVSVRALANYLRRSDALIGVYRIN